MKDHINNKNIWISWTELKSKLKGKNEIFLFGKSQNLIPKTLKKLKFSGKISIIDNNKDIEGSSYFDLKILDAKKILKNSSKNIFIIICVEPYSIIPQLLENNLIPGNNYVCTPAIEHWGKLQMLKNFTSDIIFTSSDFNYKKSLKGSKSGGGIFLANFQSNSYEKKIAGQFRQIIKTSSGYYAINFVKKEIVKFNNNFKILNKFKISQKNKNTKYCGLTYDEKNQVFYMVNTTSDFIEIFDRKFKKLDEICFLEKKYRKKNLYYFNEGVCHLNDLVFSDNKLYVSYFSLTGRWRDNLFDGGLCEIDPVTHKKKIKFKNLYQPHSPHVYNNDFYILDSMRGILLNNKGLKIKFNGFIRGVDINKDYFFIGQSESMYLNQRFSKINKEITNCNSGIYCIDKSNNCSRFLSTPDVMNIHSLHLIKNK